MAVKTYKPRIDFKPLEREDAEDRQRFRNRSDEILQWLWDTHVAFNEGVSYLVSELLRMRRGAGVWRERSDGVWGEWQPIRNLEELQQVQQRRKTDGANVSLVENAVLIERLTAQVGDRQQAVLLAATCSAIFDTLCPTPKEDEGDGGKLVEMERDSLDLLTNSGSCARGLREPPWVLDRVAAQEAKNADSFDELVAGLKKQPKFQDPQGGRSSCAIRTLKKLQKLKRQGDRDGTCWEELRRQIQDQVQHPKWALDETILRECSEARDFDDLIHRLSQLDGFANSQGQLTEEGTKAIDRLKKLNKTPRTRGESRSWSDAKNLIIAKAKEDVRDYAHLKDNNCLPLPGFARYIDEHSIEFGELKLHNCGSEWKRAMWNLAGQKARSHLGWVRRRSREQLLWHLEKKLFEEGGWLRKKEKGKEVKVKDRRPDHILFSRPEEDLDDFRHCPSYRMRRWFRQLQEEYEGVEMPRLFAGLTLGAKALPRVSERMLKGWAKIRQKWCKTLTRNPSATVDELIEQVNLLRKRKPRDFGDQSLFRWLVEPGRRYLWDGSDRSGDNDCGRDDRDCVAAFAAYNERFAELPSSITFTENHALAHPVWAFFGENSAVKYKLRCEEHTSREGRTEKKLYAVFDQLLCRKPDGSGYTSVSDVCLPLRGYRDFQESFDVPVGREISSTAPIKFRDDLLAGFSLMAKLGGIKVIWDREDFPKNAKQVSAAAPTKRVYVSFSCDVEEKQPPAWLAARDSEVGAIITKSRDGVNGLLELRRTIKRNSSLRAGTNEDGLLLLPAKRAWPEVAVKEKLRALSVDLGQRHGAGLGLWELRAGPTTDSLGCQVGQTNSGIQVHAALINTDVISLPGDDETVTATEEQLRSRLRWLRSRLNLQRMLLQVARLLSLEQFERREFGKDKSRHRRGGFDAPCGRRSVTAIERLTGDEVRRNCEKASQLLLTWAPTDSMQESLRSLGHNGDLWSYLEAGDPQLKTVSDVVPHTTVPSEKEAREASLDRDSLKAQRDLEDQAFFDSVIENRTALARSLCGGYDAALRKRAITGLWAELDRALVREVSYSDRREKENSRELFTTTGLIPLLRRPPAKKHETIVDQNRLPLGETLRGGLSMQRLNFLEEVRAFVRKWSCRPRWPGDVRRLARDRAFGVQDARHLNNLREHRVKLLSHCIVARALGFEPDIRRGIWRFRDTSSGELLWHHPETRRFFRELEDRTLQQVGVPPGVTEYEASHPHPVHTPAHLIVLEDLARYKFKRDRPRNENAGLMLWSHRQLLKFIKHIGGLFGLPLAVVYAAYSSRFCSRCGAPGSRASRFDPKWLDQEWMRRIRESNEIQDQVMKKVANEVAAKLDMEPGAYDNDQDRPWIVREGGTHFACANRNCAAHTKPIDADVNAAANIGLRFLRGVEDFRITVTPDGKPVTKLHYSSVERLVKADGDEFWQQPSDESTAKESPTRRKRRKSITTEEDLGEEVGEGSSVTIIRDPSGNALPAENWYEEDVFWGDHVARRVATGIKAANADVFSISDDSNGAAA